MAATKIEFNADGLMVFKEGGILFGESDDPCCCGATKHCYDYWHYDCATTDITNENTQCLASDPAGTGGWVWNGSDYVYIQKNDICTGTGEGNCTPSTTPPSSPGDTSNCPVFVPCSDGEVFCLLVEIFDTGHTLLGSFTMCLLTPCLLFYCDDPSQVSISCVGSSYSVNTFTSSGLGILTFTAPVAGCSDGIPLGTYPGTSGTAIVSLVDCP